MKKILLATSALVLVAGAAAAEVTVSGAGRMGLVHSYFVDGADAGTDVGIGDAVDTRFSSRIRIIFTASGESDSGFSFGASVRNDQSGVGNNANGDSTVFISGAFGKLTMGDVGNAADSLVGQVSGVGYTGIGDYNEIGWVGTEKTGVRYEYSTGSLTFALGSSQIDAAAGAESVSLAVKYATDAFSIALGYEDGDTIDQISAKGTASFGGAKVALKLVDRDTVADLAAALSVDYTTGAATITAFATDNYNFAGADSVGIGASYDLGGGASVAGGIVDNGTDTVADLGMNFSF
jgi:outer membrane protein OmpU